MMVIRRLTSSGDAMIGLIVDPIMRDRMAPVLRFSDTNRHQFIIEISADEVRDLAADAATLLNADEGQVRQWWAKFSPRAKAVANV